jgi:peptide subunit release factor 1 (eRF1)
MIDERSIQELASFQLDGTPVLSLYLNVDPQRRTREEYKLALRLLLESVSGQADARDVERIERYVELEHNRQGKAVACFSSVAQGFWRVFSLLIPREDLIFVGERPYVKPLTDVMERYAVALVNREGVRLFSSSTDAVEEATGMEGEDIKHHRAGGWAAQRYQRHEDEAAQRNLRDAAELTDDFCRQNKCDRLILGGTEINVAQFEELLPQALRERVISHITIDKDASPAEVGERAAEAIQTYLAQRESALVEELFTTAAKGGAAAMGLADTLSALHSGRIHHLVVERGYQAPAYRCQNCGYMTVEAAATCGFCGSDTGYLPDAVDTLVRNALQQGLEVTLVHDNATLQQRGHIGALLRY